MSSSTSGQINSFSFDLGQPGAKGVLPCGGVDSQRGGRRGGFRGPGERNFAYRRSALGVEEKEKENNPGIGGGETETVRLLPARRIN